ncbi:MAG: hypothetical protein NPIRA01_24330 [Nitrospirales bacterium]|nr:MAG: hypothetical protein NPIRA01_24330 [Nitrospirales bacterium]
MPDARKIGQCQNCGKDQFDKSVSERFREFLEEYVARLPKEYIDQMYRLRSAIVHGGRLMPRDREISNISFNAGRFKKDSQFNLLQMVCQVVLVNWLHSEKRAIVSNGEAV